MPGKDSTNDQASNAKKGKATTSSQVVTADSVQAEEVPTIPLGPIQTLNSLQPEVTVHSVASTRSVSMPSPLVVQPSEYRRSLGEWLQIWWEGIRPSYLPLSILPLLLGSVLAWMQTITIKTPLGHFHFLHFLLALASIILLQIGAHLINDYYDYMHGIDTSNGLGPGGLIQQGLVKPANVLAVGLTALAFGTLGGIIVAMSGGLLVYVFGLVGLLCAYFYSATARSLSSLGLSELVSFLVFGPLITLGAYMIQTGHADRFVFVYSLPLGFLAAAVIHGNNMRDIESDAQAGKHTLASLVGLRLSRGIYLLLLIAAYVPLLVLAVPRHTLHLLLITLWTLPTLVVLITGILRTDTPAGLHQIMLQTIRLATYFTLLLAVALLITALWPVLPHIPAALPF